MYKIIKIKWKCETCDGCKIDKRTQGNCPIMNGFLSVRQESILGLGTKITDDVFFTLIAERGERRKQ